MLKYISTKEFDIKESFNLGLLKIKQQSKFQKFMTYFWILGPFIYLIERDPADLWLTIISTIFLIRCIVKKDWYWSGQLWFVFAILLWMTGLFSSLIGPYKAFSFFEGFVWIRFPLYAAAAQVWLGRDNDIRTAMFVSILTGMIVMCFILIAEIVIDESKTRLMWPYGDLVPGGYLSKISLPVFCTFIVMIVINFNRTIILNFIICILSVFLIFATGERGNFFIRVFSGFLAIFSWRFKLKTILSFILFSIFTPLMFLGLFYKFNNKQFNRYTTDFFKSIPLINMTDVNPYWGAWRSGIQQGLSNPVLGLGPSSSRKHCKKLTNENGDKSDYTENSKDFNWLPGKNYCGNHPHNFYIQLFAETGVIGLFFGTLMFFFILRTCYVGRFTNPNSILTSICYIIPLAIFFPFQQTGSFFGQWNSLFIWFPIGFCLSQIQDFKSIFRK